MKKSTDGNGIQLIFEDGIRHMLRQRKPALGKGGNCTYQTIVGGVELNCIVGGCIRKEELAMLVDRGYNQCSADRREVIVALTSSGYDLGRIDGRVKNALVEMQSVLHDVLQNVLEEGDSLEAYYLKEVPLIASKFGLWVPLDIQVALGLIPPKLFTDK